MASSKNIKYQILEYKYVNSLIECIVEAETQEGSFLYNMRINKERLEQVFINFLKHEDLQIYNKILIGIDTSDDQVIAFVVGEDLQDVIKETNQKQEDKVIDQYCGIQKLVLSEMSEQFKLPGEMMIVDSYGVRRRFQELKIGQIILTKYLDHIESLGYLCLSGLCTSRACLHICKKLGGKVAKSLHPKELFCIDSSLCSMFKENIEIPIIYCKKYQMQQQQLINDQNQ
ncbi:hypothetical protein TTHERM_00390140 (macronuclear) [Tetrahymena thermophila SB210]|uniref:Uncharacterized protein n=1 Tax=Tetrahymena thermophila (strain SB210) TaxID=312017 RepID=Q23R74_TETTS|nr:hypothetical protein TTHERM_00390140 [Tetrahymena thermophila SB210]EAR99174.1 hypothetical protein TTHERM_00390140 [Tetrahymena thermophila SB210]|eukprot:XP_001019419.1 hypothetical protein TTHERM_00390140 [Tetrahymena thermophila SB210]